MSGASRADGTTGQPGLWNPSEYWRLSWRQLRAELAEHKADLVRFGKRDEHNQDARDHALACIAAALREGRARVATARARADRGAGRLARWRATGRPVLRNGWPLLP